MRRMRQDAGLSRRALAAAAGVDDRYLGQLERGQREPSITMLVALASALGGDAHIRLYPGTGPRLRDPIQARIAEGLLRVADLRWQRHVEVPVYRPVRGVIDIVLVDRMTATIVAIEVHSELRRLEQQLRWANEKAEALPSSTIWPGDWAVHTAAPGPTTGAVPPAHPPTVHRLMILRSTRTNRRLAAEFATTLATAYPASASRAIAALTEADVTWPGSAWLWASVDGGTTRLTAPTVDGETSRIDSPDR